MRRLAGLLGASVGASVGALVGALLAGGAGAAAPADTSPCWLKGWPHAARCGVLQRPLDPARPQGLQIDLHYAVVPAVARNKAPDAVFFFAGGPGQSAIELAGALAAAHRRLQQRRDLVFIDQRGTGRSAPLACPDDDVRAPLRPLAERSDDARRLAALQACRQVLQALPHGDLRFYSTEIAMADVDAVRQALGIGRINAIGASYGTRAVLSYQRQFPQAVRRAVLDGVAPPDMRLPDAAAADNQAAYDALLQACAADAGCTRRHPDLAQRLPRLLASLPRSVSLPHPVSGRLETLTLQPETLLAMVRTPLYSPALAAALPAALAEAADGRWAALAALAQALGSGGAGGFATGQHFSVVCSEDLGPGAPAAPPALPASAVFAGGASALYQAACAGWPRAAVSAAFYTLPPAQTPTWLLSGTLDPVTPPRHGQRVALALGPLARHTVVPNAGHGVLALPCLRDAVARFISTDDGAQALATPAECAAGLPRPPAFVPPGLAAEGRP
jgi:pimeloyl-ACP methyl ester carboxylesterase